jgi:hypothetical protein
MIAAAQSKIVGSLADYIKTLKAPAFLLGLDGAPVTPWYLGQPDPGGKLLPALYRGSINPELEREMLREFRMLAAEFIPPKGVLDREWLVQAHQNGLPSRIIEWQANALAALFLAVESMDVASYGRVWIFNPWAFNDAGSGLPYVPMIDEPFIDKYVVKLSDPQAKPMPEAEPPMAFRPYRNLRNYNLQNTFFTIHGNDREPLEAMRFVARKNGIFLTYVLIDGAQKKAIMKDLYSVGVTRAALFPGAASVAKTLAYRFSKDYASTDIKT